MARRVAGPRHTDGASSRAGEFIGLPESPLASVRLDKVHITRAAAPFAITDVQAISMSEVDVQAAPDPAGVKP